MKRRTRFLAIILAAPLFGMLAGCPFSTDPTPKDDDDDNGGEVIFLPRTSVENLLENLKQSYLKRDFDQYDSLLAPEFEFVYKPDESTIEEFMDVEEERKVHQRIFGTQYVQELDLSFDVGIAELDSTQYDTTYEQFRTTTLLTNVYLRLIGTTPDHPTVTEDLEVQDGRQQFWFVRTSYNDPTTNQPIWKIIRWEDLDTTEGGERLP